MVVVSCNPDLWATPAWRWGPVPRGSGLRARHAAGQGTYCEFRTAQALRLWPLEVKRAQYFSYAPDLALHQHPRARDIRGGLRVALQATAGLTFDKIALDDLVIHLGGAEDVAWQLHECLLGQPLGVLLQPLGPSGGITWPPGGTARHGGRGRGV